MMQVTHLGTNPGGGLLHYNCSVHVYAGGAYEPPLPERELVQAAGREPGCLPGRHLIAEMHNAAHLTDTQCITAALRDATRDAGATLLAIHHHVFTPDGGVTAFALLAESHISIHTWPEKGFAALDIFMCGACDPAACLPALIAALLPGKMNIARFLRGQDDVVPSAPSEAGQ
jgi:S-adenosylmethionine decarboxylase